MAEKNARQGVFITLEGPDGSGKTSQIPLLAEYLNETGCQVVTTREPGGTPISDQIKDVLKSMQNKAMHPRTEILLFCSARAQLVEEVIRPSLAEGKIVISDRYADSTLAYQGYGHGYDRDFLRRLLNFATGDLWPDLTLYLDLDAEEGLNRRRSEGNQWDRLDDYALAFHQRVRAGYLEMAAADPQRWKRIDACQTPAQVQAHLRQTVAAFLAKNWR
ncbi:MAG: dTMP kinase [Anaerolineaceae bacterium]|jgi:dTMP kinase|nr:dTMP kinase [Anaerolineaceae bacterium]